MQGLRCCNSASRRMSSASPPPRGLAVIFTPLLRLFPALGTSWNAAAGWSKACMPCKAERWERRLEGLLEGDGGGMKGWLRSQNHAEVCGGHDGATQVRIRGHDGARCGIVVAGTMVPAAGSLSVAPGATTVT